jgi:hypothetical protein
MMSLRESGMPENAEGNGQLEFFSKKETYLKDGVFEPDLMIKMLQDIEEDSLASGYDGFRGTGEMTWFLDKVASLHDLLGYEIKCNYFYSKSRSSGICQYNESKFDEKTLKQIVLIHPYLIVHGKLYENKYFYNPPELFSSDSRLMTDLNYDQLMRAITED